MPHPEEIVPSRRSFLGAAAAALAGFALPGSLTAQEAPKTGSAKNNKKKAYIYAFHVGKIEAAIAQAQPHDLEALQGIAGIGAKKLEAYGGEVLRVVTSA